MMPDMTDLPHAPEPEDEPETRAAIERLRTEVESLRLLTPEDNIRYWLSDEAMKND